MILMALVLVISQVSVVTFADNNGRGNSWKVDTDKSKETKIEYKNQVSEEAKIELREKLRLMVRVDGTWLGLPEGLYKKGYLNYGLSKRYASGNFPYGLAKRIGDFRYGDHEEDQDLESLAALIKIAEAKITVANASETTKKYLPDSIKNLQSAVNEAKTFVENYDESKFKLIQAAYNKLNEAIRVFDNNEIIGESYDAYWTALETTHTKLLAYQTAYGDKLTLTKKNALSALILEIENYLKPNSTLVLTMGIFNNLQERATAFEDLLAVLEGKIEAAYKMLYVDPAADPLVFNAKEGTAPDEYLVGTNASLISAITDAEKFVKNYTSQTTNLIQKQIDTLTAAMNVYEGNLILGVDDVNILKDILLELEDYYNREYDAQNNPLTNLSQLMIDIKAYTQGTLLLTKGVQADLLDRSNVYLVDLYKIIENDLKTLSLEASASLAESKYETYNGPSRPALVSKVNEAIAYLALSTKTYEGLTALVTSLEDLKSEFINDAEVFLVLPEINAKVTEAEALLLDDTKTYGATERANLEAKLLLVTNYLNDHEVIDYVYSELITLKTELNTAITAFVDSVE